MSKKIAISLISAYQRNLSPFLKTLLGVGAFCRFEETCSMYAKRQINEKGLIRGTWLGLVRLSKCQPFYSGDLRKEVI